MTKIPGSIVDAMDDRAVFGRHFEGESWNGWRSLLKAAFALPMTQSETEFFHLIASRNPPTKQVPELWVIAGRGAGKDSIASLIVAHTAALFDRPKPNGFLARLRRGERALCACLACSRDQARTILEFTRGYFTDAPSLASMIQRETLTGFELNNNTEVAIATNDFRSIRGRSILMAILDECAFYRSEESSSPDEELYRSILPGLARVPGSMLVGISSPYKKGGLLFRKFEQHYGRDSDILVVRAPTQVLNPSIDPAAVARAMQEDPVGAAAEWNAEFREDVSGYVDIDVLMKCTAMGVSERRPIDGVAYTGFLDAAGGGLGGDSAAVAISHKEDDRLILDCLVEFKPPFSAASVIDQAAKIMLRYGVRVCYADDWAKGFTSERLKANGIQFRPTPPKSALYAELLTYLYSHQCVLLDIPRLRSQLLALDRRPGSGGRDVIEHPRRADARDDAANAAAGSLVMCAAAARRGGVHVIGIPPPGSPAWNDVKPRDEVQNSGSSIGLGYSAKRGWHKPHLDSNSNDPNGPDDPWRRAVLGLGQKRKFGKG